MEPTKKLPKLKPKEKEFAKKLVINDENATQTVKEVYEGTNDDYARLKAHRLITKDNVRQEIEIQRETLKSALEKQGITPDKIARKVDELLNNEDYQAIDKGLKHATSIYGVESEDNKPKSTNTYNFLFSAETQAEIREIENRIKAKLINGTNKED